VPRKKLILSFYAYVKKKEKEKENEKILN